MLEEIIHRAIYLRENTDPKMSFSSIAAALSVGFNREITKDMVQKQYQRHGTVDQHPPKSIKPQSKYSGADNYREAYDYLGTTLLSKPEDELVRSYKTKRQCVALGDLHGSPCKELLVRCAHEEPDHVIFGGDLWDMNQINQHGSNKEVKRTLLQDESAQIRAAVEFFIRNTRAKLDFIEGNHDRWAYNQAAELLPPVLLEYFNDPLDVLIASLPKSRITLVNQKWQWNYPYQKEPTDFGYSRFMYLFGDALLSHANFTDKWAGGAVKKLNLWLNDWQAPLGIPELGLLVQFHGHKISLNYEKGGHQVWVEPGMAAEPQVENYKTIYKTAWRPGAQGALYFDQNLIDGQWITDKHSIRLILP